jgi:hypothetical protein
VGVAAAAYRLKDRSFLFIKNSANVRQSSRGLPLRSTTVAATVNETCPRQPCRAAATTTKQNICEFLLL